MRTFTGLLALAITGWCAAALADSEKVRTLPAGQLPNDVRLQPVKDLDGYFPFTPPKSKEEWEKRAAEVRQRILVSQGLVPMPTRTPLNAVIHGKIDRPEYTIEKVYFESIPGFYVTGNLYRPKNPKGKVPGVLFAHGHWVDARLSFETDDNLRQEIATGQERFEKGGKSRFQAMCVQLARMGCVVWQWDMLGASDANQLTTQLVHGFSKQRPEMNTTENWGLYSSQAEAHLQSIMGLQTWNAERSLDFLLSLPEIDSERIAMTGASGGGTQTMILSAIDPRIKLSFPAVMVSTAMQGGCTCENASLLRINTGNVEFAALFAPKPQGVTCAHDWTKEMSTKGFPQLKQLYELMGAPNEVMLSRGEQFPHNYNAVSRSAFFTWLNSHFKLGEKEPVIEKDYEPLTREQLSVWDAKHPAPKFGDPEFERKLLHWITEDAKKQLEAAAKSGDEFRKLAGMALATIIGRNFEKAGEVEWTMGEPIEHADYAEVAGLLRNNTYSEELPMVVLLPDGWNRSVVVWLDDAGKSAIRKEDGSLKPEVRELLKNKSAVVAVDLLFQGEFLKDGEAVKQTRKVKNPRESAAYTFCYNDSLFAQRVHDVLTTVKFLRTVHVDGHPTPATVKIVGLGNTGPIVIAARAVAGDTIDAVAVDTGGFRFGKLLDYRDPQFLPGGAKYLDLPGMIALSTKPLWLAGETAEPSLGANNKKSTSTDARPIALFRGEKSEVPGAAVTWTLGK
jgi:dienelactone hydrolase